MYNIRLQLYLTQKKAFYIYNNVFKIIMALDDEVYLHLYTDENISILSTFTPVFHDTNRPDN